MSSLFMASSSTASSSMEASFATLDIHEHRRTPLTFHSFSKLPHEVQNIIWGFAGLNLANDSLNETRVIIQRNFRRYTNRHHAPYLQGARPAYPGPAELSFAAPYGMPSVLQVSSRLRAEVLKLLPFPVMSWFEGEKRPHYFDFDRDVLFLEDIVWFKTRTTGNETVLHWSIPEGEKIRSIRRIVLMIIDGTAPGRLLTSLKDNRRMRDWVGDLLIPLASYVIHGTLKEVLVLLPKSLNYYPAPGLLISKLDLHRSLVRPPQRENLDVEAQSLEGTLQREWSQRMDVMGKQISLSIRYAEFRLPM